MKNVKKIIKGIDLFIHSANKEGKHLPNVYSGTGSHKSIKDYSRKRKYKRRFKEEEEE